MHYCHTQRAPLGRMFFLLAIALCVGAWFCQHQAPAMLILLGVAATFVLVGLMFGRLTVFDGGDQLAIHYGPLPVFRRRISYSAITSVEPGRSAIIDGWGIHWIPGRGWTYNLWGFDCAKLSVNGWTIRIGSDDVPNLVEFVNSKIR